MSDEEELSMSHEEREEEFMAPGRHFGNASHDLLALLIHPYPSEDERAEGDGEITATKDGLADMMSRILNQQTGANPVLAKRKTPLMKGTSLSLHDVHVS